DRSEFGVRGREHLHGAELQGFELFLVLVKRRVGIDLDLDLAVGIFLREFLELVGGLALRRIGRDDMAELDHNLSLGHGRGTHEGERRNRCRQDQLMHISSRTCSALWAQASILYASRTNTDKLALLSLPL